MIHSQGPELCAVYNTEGGRQESRPVMGWDEEGYALTVSWAEGRLTRAVDIPGFVCLDDDEAKHATVRTVLPAPAGWTLTTREAGRKGVQPIVGWTVNGFGCGEPLVVGPDGGLEVASTNGAVASPPGKGPGGALSG